VVSSTPVKYSIQAEPDKDSIIKAILKAKEAGQNVAGSKYWRTRLSHKKYVKKIQELCKYEPKSYWEHRAKSWDKQAGTGFPDLDQIEPLLLDMKPETVLDIGCGSGRWYPYFEKQNVNYRGIDISENLVKMAQEKFPGVMFKACKVEDIPKPPHKFDLGFCYTTLEHITEEEFPKAVKALKESCKKLILIEPVNFTSRAYCHSHNYERHFNVIKKVPLKDKIIFVIDNENS
jgi:2-polyprenyl-3-methyl-5-hydroxy-6-metoxy-1,4-benzoquinol methylase